MEKGNKGKSAKNQIKLRPSLKSFWAAWFFFIIATCAALAPGVIVQLSFEAIPGPSEKIFGTNASASEFWVLLLGGIIAIVIATRYIVYPLLANRYFVNDEQIVEVYGLIKKERKSSKLEHILTVNEDIGYMGRLLGFGDVVFFTAGSGGEDIRMSNVDNPAELAAEIQKRADKASEHDSSGGYSKEQAERQQSQIDKLANRLEQVVELNAQLREQVAVLSWRLDHVSSSQAGESTPDLPSAACKASTPVAPPNHAADADSSSRENPNSGHQEDSTKTFSAANVGTQSDSSERRVASDDTFDIDDFSDDLTDTDVYPEPEHGAGADHKMHADADSGPRSSSLGFDESESVGLMSRQAPTTDGQ